MEIKICQNCKNEFKIEGEDFSFYEKIKVPPPTFCPDCRMIRRFMFRNERVWYRRDCMATGKKILSMYSPDLPLVVYDQEHWRSDNWDPLSYGRKYDFDIDFFTQFQDLFQSVPHPNLIQKNMVNTEYSNYALNAKNCYYIASVDGAEDSAYLFGSVVNSYQSMDLYQSGDSDQCYELIDCQRTNRVFFSQNCESCTSSYFLYDCRNCSFCFGCVGLRSKNYCIFNIQYSKEEYFEKLKEMGVDSFTKLKEYKNQFEDLKKKVPRKYAVINNSQDVSGDNISNSQNCHNVFSIWDDIQDSRYSFRLFKKVKDGYDGYVVWNGSELFYEDVSCSGQRIFFSAYIWGGFDIEYSYNCFDCNNIFGCIGLKNKSYCIFNTQYSKEEYFKLKKQIKEQMNKMPYIDNLGRIYSYGEFFPASLSPFAYNETVAQEYFPTNQEDAFKYGYPWRTQEKKEYGLTMRADELPDTIGQTPELITKEVIGCEHNGRCNNNCSTAFKIAPQEFLLYKTLNLPLPRLCPQCRHSERLGLINPMKLYHRQCMCKKGSHNHTGNCLNEFETPYAPESSEIVYCEDCYQSEVQ